MKRWLRYENIWVRNFICAVLFFVLIYIQSKFIPPEYRDTDMLSDGEGLFIFCLTYFFIFINNYFFVRKLLFEKRYGSYAIVSLLYIIALTFLTSWINIFFKLPGNFISDFLSTFMTDLTGTAFYFIHTWILNNMIKTQKKLVEKEAELNFLKYQLSPHFLFNAINNLYGTALVAPEIISHKLLELSDLLRYQIDSTSKDFVFIDDEMTFVNNFINYTHYKRNNLVCSNETIGEVKAYYLPPLIFLPLIENAIKYSAETEHAFINIKWKFEADRLAFQIENSYLMEGSKIIGTKVGLENLHKRLDILDLKYQLDVDTRVNNVYKTDLIVWNLSTNV